jgi:N-acetylglucosaminyl-diphospho-decaprenol L-rhamnosyltransferase
VTVSSCYLRPMDGPEHFRPAAAERADLSVVVVSYNTVSLLDRMFAALNAARGKLQVQIIVVDNASRDGSPDFLRRNYPDVELIENTVNVGFGRANNQAVARAGGRYVLLLNTDAFVGPDTLSKTIEYMDTHPDCGVLGVKLVGSDGALQPSCRYFPTPWNVFLQSTGLMRLWPNTPLVDDMSWDHNSVRTCDWVPGCYYLIRRDVIDRVGMFDPRYFIYYEEVDHCRAVRAAGWQVVYYPFTEVVHIGGESAKADSKITKVGRQISMLQIESELLYFRKFYGVSGVVAGVVLSILADALSAVKGLVRNSDLGSVAGASRHVRAIFKVLSATGFASHPTR